MIKLKDLLNERMYGKQLNDKFYPAHSREALSWSLTHDYVPIYPKTMESIIGKVPVDAFHVTGLSRKMNRNDYFRQTIFFLGINKFFFQFFNT